MDPLFLSHSEFLFTGPLRYPAFKLEWGEIYISRPPSLNYFFDFPITVTPFLFSSMSFFVIRVSHPPSSRRWRPRVGGNDIETSSQSSYVRDLRRTSNRQILSRVEGRIGECTGGVKLPEGIRFVTLSQTQPMRAVPPIQRTYTHSVSLGESKSSVESCLARERKEKTKFVYLNSF